jgi:hypothetical protein
VKNAATSLVNRSSTKNKFLLLFISIILTQFSNILSVGDLPSWSTAFAEPCRHGPRRLAFSPVRPAAVGPTAGGRRGARRLVVKYDKFQNGPK